MDTETILRIFHIFFGILWAGTTFFNVFVLEPRLRKLGPQFQAPVTNAIMPALAPLMMLSSIVVLLTGLFLSFSLWISWETIFSSTAGWMLFTAFVATTGAILIGKMVLTPTGKKIGQLSRALEGRAPTPEEAGTLKILAGRMSTFSKTNFVLVLLSVLIMAVLRAY